MYPLRLAAAIFAVLPAALPCAAARDAAALVGEYAVCAGRLSAETEHMWLMQDPLAPAAELQRDWMDALYRGQLTLANAAGVPRSEALLARIRAKRAQARLLETARFNSDARRARMARSLSERHSRLCLTLLRR